MRVPELEESAGLNPTSPDAPRLPPPPEAAFGGQIADAASRLGRTVQDMGQQLAERIGERQDMQKEQNAYDAYTAYGKGLQDLMHKVDPDTGQPVMDPQTGKPEGLLDRNLSDAKGTTLEYDQKQAQLLKAQLDTLKTPMERSLFMRVASYHGGATREMVLSHETQQGTQAYNESVNAGLGSIAESAVNVTDGPTLAKAVRNAVSINSAALAHHGVQDPGVAAQNNQSVAAAVVEKPINQQLANGGWKVAQGLLEATKDNLSPDAVAHLQTAISGRAFDDTQNSAWQTLKTDPSLRMIDGKTFDEDKARDFIMDPEKFDLKDPITNQPLNTQQREKIADFVKSMAGEESIQRRKQEVASSNQFANDIVGAWKQGASYSDAVKLVADPKYGFDATAALDEQSFVKKLYTQPDTKSNPDVAFALWKGVKEGQIDKPEDLRAAFKNGLLSNGDYLNLLKQQEEAQTKGVNTAANHAWTQIGSEAEGAFPDKTKRQDFMHALQVEADTKGLKDPGDIQKLYEDRIKSAPTGATRGWLNPMRYVRGADVQGPSWQGEQHREIERNSALGELNASMGKDVVEALGGDPAKVADMAKNLGGIDLLKAGTPANNAVKSLNALGISPTPAKVKALIEQTGNGIVPPGSKVSYQ
ncbi:MAG TPA: hypothetical protein VH309_00230 [Elusimicrobiota bacterium]|jgi:hypothetical protein|nr:hypothetical protein [Elusimicrobiota bacterium]